MSAETPNIPSTKSHDFFHSLGRAKESVQVRGALKYFATNYFSTLRGC
jgi:hypothetical protein